MEKPFSIVGWGVALLVWAILGAAPAHAEAAKSLVIGEKSRIVSSKEDHLIVVLDLKPNAAELKKAAAGAPDVITATAAYYAREYLAKPEFKAVPQAMVYLLSIENMDEYNHANFNGMKRYGTLTFKRNGPDVVLTENKMSFSQ